jgi:nitroreductase
VRTIKERLWRLRARFYRRSARFFSSGGRLSAVYYAFVNNAFRRETVGVLSGQASYHARVRAVGASSWVLRRNVHRLEKGIIMRPRREVFARDYIDETVDNYATLSALGDEAAIDPGELQWARDVLTEFFAITGTEPVIDRARARFAGVVSEQDRSQGMVPYARTDAVHDAVSYDDFVRLCRQRRSVRWYQQRPVPRDLIDRAIEAAAQAPSACNRQPITFRVFDDPALVQQIAGIPGGTAGFRQNFPAIVVIVGDLSAFFDERDRHLIYIDGSLSAMSFTLALETLGLSSCLINWPDTPSLERAMAQALGLQRWERVIMLCSVGYADPDGMIPFSQKKSLDKFRSYNA